jgi:hypothetical protein
MSAWQSTSGTASIQPQQPRVPFARVLNNVSLAVVAGSVSLAVGAIPASATLTITAEQVGSDVIVSALGSLDFSTFFYENVGSYSPPGLPPPPVSFLFTDDLFGTPTINLATTGNSIAPISSLKRFRSYMFGSGPALNGMTTSQAVSGGQIGEAFGFYTLTVGDLILYTPSAFDPMVDPVLTYSGTNQFTLPGTTLAMVGLTPGSRTWSGGGVDVVRLNVVPGPLPLLGLSSSWFWVRRLRQRAGEARRIQAAPCTA